MHHEYTVGDIVFVVGFGGDPSKRTTVTAVKSYKRGPKVTAADGTEWDVDGSCMWGQRGTNYYTGPRLAPHTDELQAQFRTVLRKSRVRWLAREFDELTPEQQETLGEAAIKIYRERKE